MSRYRSLLCKAVILNSAGECQMVILWPCSDFREFNVNREENLLPSKMDPALSEEDQIEEMKDCFSLFDTVGDMRVEWYKIVNVLRSLGLNPLESDVDKVLKDSKLEKTRIDFETFYGIYNQLSKVPSSGSYDDIVLGFDTMDRDQCGLVKYTELKLILQNVGEKMNEEEIDAIVSQHEDMNKNIIYRDMIRRVMSA